MPQTLSAEFACRRQRSCRYSLRAFARDLGTDHATLSQILRGRRVASPKLLRQFGGKLRLPAADIAEACKRHDTDAILRVARWESFRPNSRWIATRTGLPLDSVNAAIARLLNLRQLIMESAGQWNFIRPPYA